jgi:hypothetical protein
MRLALAFALLLAPVSTLAAEYHWNAVVPAQWNAPSSWSPNRITPLSTDRLVFDNGGTPNPTSVPTATIAQLVVSNGTRVTLNPQPAAVLTIAGDTGSDFDIATGSSVAVVSANALSISLASGATGSIAGTFSAADGAHRLLAADADGIQFVAGGKAAALTGFTGNLFGLTTLNSVRFQSGSVYAQGAGANPFGAGQPSSVVVFDHGSLYQVNTSVALSVAGRTYANLEYNGSGISNSTGSADCTVDSIVVNSGTLTLALSANMNIKGSIRVRTNGVLNLGPTSGSVVYRLNGSAAQILADSSSAATGIAITRPVNILINNPAGIETSANARTLTVPGTLTFNSGVLRLNGGMLDIDSTGIVLGASAANGWVNGRMAITFTQPSNARRFETGTSTSYGPFDLGVFGLTGPQKVNCSTLPRPTPDFFLGSQIDSVRKLNLSYRIQFTTPSGWSSFLTTAMWNPGDVDPAANANQFVTRVYSHPNGTVFADGELPWRPAALLPGSQTPTALGANNVAKQNFTDTVFGFAIGDTTVPRISAFDAGVPENNGAVPIHVKLSERAIAPVSVHFQTTDNSAVAGADYTTTAGNLTLGAGQTDFVVSVPTVVDAVPEPDETFTLTLSSPSNAAIDDGTAIGTILDDDDVTPPSAQVLYPNGGETITEGSNVNLLWSATDNVDVVGVDLFLSTDDGANYSAIATGIPNSGSYAWTAPVGLTHLARLKVIASDHRSQTGTDASDGPWSIWGVDAVDPALPSQFAFQVVSANPTRAGTRLRFALPRDQHVRLTVHDARGRIVSELVNGAQAAGIHMIEWDGRTAVGVAPAGMYFVSITTDEWNARSKIVRL